MHRKHLAHFVLIVTLVCLSALAEPQETAKNSTDPGPSEGGAPELAAGAALPHARSLAATGTFEVEGGVQTSPASGPVRFGVSYEITGGLRGVARPAEPMLFGDDFETGDLSGWSETNDGL